MKKAIVVGGTTGIGAGIAKELQAHNYETVVTGIEQDIINQINLSGNSSSSAEYLNCISDPISDSLEKIVEKLGGLDLLVLSAGIGNLNKDLGHTVENVANKVNVLAFTEIMDWSYRYFYRQGHGQIAAISSISGLIGSRIAPAYHAAKSYQISYMEGLRQKAHQARKSEKDIYITDIRPGFVATPMTEGKKMIWVSTVDKAARQAYQLIKRKKSHGYVSRRWNIAAIIIKLVPTPIRNWI